MSFLPDYEDDIFISYAHNDNQPVIEGQPGWVDLFHKALDRRLTVHLGAKASVWRDPRLQGNEYFADTLVEQIPKVAILISVLSPSYINSEWCRREMQMFSNIATETGGVRLGNKARIFKVEKIHVPLDKHPAELQGMTGYEFYYKDDHRARELSADSGPHAIEYWQRIDDVAQDIATLLQDIKLRAANPDVQVFEQPAGETVYLAETSSDLSPQRDNIKRELQERGHVVIPDRPLPLNGPELEDSVRHYLETSKLSIHLIGSNYGVIPEAADRSVVCLQNDLAAERCKGNGFARLIWLPEGLETREERQREFIEHLKFDTDAQKGADVLQTSIEELKTYIQDKLRPKPKSGTGNGNGNGNAHPPEAGPLRVYLVCDKQDYEQLAPVEEHLYNSGFEVTLPLFEGDEAEVREDHKESLLICDAVVIFYGNASEGWLRTKLRDLQKIPGYGRTKPMLAQAIYAGPPETPAKQRYRTREALLLRNFGNFTPDSLQPFLDEIKKAKG
jgi:hypothetical protein